MSSENVIHIKLDYMEALQGQRGILTSELGALNVAKRISRYREIRMNELALKTRIYLKIKETKSNIRKLQLLLPNPKIPALLNREHNMEKMFERDFEKDTKGKKEKAALNDEGSIESQLREIQRRLERLQG